MNDRFVPTYQLLNMYHDIQVDREIGVNKAPSFLLLAYMRCLELGRELSSYGLTVVEDLGDVNRSSLLGLIRPFKHDSLAPGTDQLKLPEAFLGRAYHSAQRDMDPVMVRLAEKSARIVWPNQPQMLAGLGDSYNQAAAATYNNALITAFYLEQARISTDYVEDRNRNLRFFSDHIIVTFSGILDSEIRQEPNFIAQLGFKQN